MHCKQHPPVGTHVPVERRSALLFGKSTVTLLVEKTNSGNQTVINAGVVIAPSLNADQPIC
jgi:hypothetical protein